MRIEAVKADAFGPFAGERLELAPGMNVVYGPNESGKSSWHAAIYAALCGIKKTRGQPTREDRAFASRHRPWRGTAWRVSAVITLDDGRTIEIEQAFGPTGRSVATDRSTKKPLPEDISRGGAVDAATLLGLTRETALATLFIRQADVLRVLNEAGALQEYLERAAATNTTDTTADEALARIAAYKRDRVGLLRVGSRGPLATISGQLTEARRTLDTAEERFESYQELLTGRDRAEAAVSEVEWRLAELVEHERERHHRERWQEIRAAERELEQARRLAEEISSGPRDEGPGKELLTAVTRALAAFEARPPEPAPLEGPTAEELERKLATVPALPEGDVEPARAVTSSLDRWRGESQRLAAHDDNEPVIGEAAIPTQPSEVRRLADELELPVPEVDPLLVEEVERRRAVDAPSPPRPVPAPPPPPVPPEPSSGSTSRAPIVIGGSLALIGIALLVLGQPIVGAVALLVGLIAAVAVSVNASRVATVATVAPPAAVAEVTAPPGPDFELTRLEARLALQQESEAQAQRRRDSAFARLAEFGLPEDAGALRQLAAEGDTAASSQTRHAEWQRRRTDLEQTWSSAAEALRDVLSGRGVAVVDGSDLEQHHQHYVEACRRRAEIARQAGRRPDLEAQLVSRRAAEAARAQDTLARTSAERQLLDVAQQAVCEASSFDDLAAVLRNWVLSQGELDETRQKHETIAARLDQLLDNRTIDELEVELAELRADAADPPPGDMLTLDDRSAALEALQSEASHRRNTLAELTGQVEGAEGHLLDVSQAVEAEARANAEVRRLTALAEDLDLASQILTAAREKVHADIAPVLNETIRPWVPRITRGRYDDIRVNPATLELEAHEAGSQFRTATVLSHGTTEQLFLLLRLALAQRLTTTGERAPIVLDDITVQSDADRTVAALDLMHDLSAAHQVILFSQEEEVLRWAEAQLKAPSDQLIRLVGRD